MEENPVETDVVSGGVLRAGESMSMEGWISPEVLAAFSGEQVQFGKDLTENDPNNLEDDQNDQS